jgi:hypothetical protein
VLKTYSMDFDQLLATPIKRFWFLNRQVDRLRAEEELRQISLLAAAGSQESYTKAIENLEKSLGEIAVFQPVAKVFDIKTQGRDPEFDQAGLHALASHTKPRRRKISKD